MALFPEEVQKAWDNREDAVIFTTVSSTGVPNAIYATCVSKHEDESILIADNYFAKTNENIRAKSRGSLLFLTKERKSYQLKGSIEYYSDGPYFDDMKTWNPTKHPGHGVAVLKVEEIYKGAEKLL